MTTDQFVQTLKAQTSDSSVIATVATLEHSAGRKPAPRLVRLSAWYAGLSESERSLVRQVIEEAAESAIFGFLCVLDGVRAMEDGPDKGEFKLVYAKHGSEVLLNNPADEFLHDSYNRLCHKESD